MSEIFYFDKRDKLRAEAVAHTQIMAESFASEIQASIEGTKVYSPDFKLSREEHPVRENTSIQRQTMDSVSSIISQKVHNPSAKVAVLNFASYKNPGGMFIGGSSAQEESLCHASYLYNVLNHFYDSFYGWNRRHLNNALYLNRGLYTPNVMFQMANDTVYADVITVPAPNKNAAMRFGRVTERDNLIALKNRINFVIDIAEDNNVNILILGAFGCGVFKQNPHDVAFFFKERCQQPSSISKYIFAIPPDGANYPTFDKVLFENK